MNVEIRSAEIGDVEIIFDFINQLAVYEKMENDVTGSVEQLKTTLFGEHAFAEVILAEFEEKTVGFALFFHNYSTFLTKPGIYLEDLFVLPQFRGYGCGKALLKHLSKLAIDRGCGRVEWSVLDWNDPAIDFYKSIGAHPMDGWTVFRLTGDALDSFVE